PDELSILSGIEAMEGFAHRFVCFGTSWPVDCCMCSRPEVALFARGWSAARMSVGEGAASLENRRAGGKPASAAGDHVFSQLRRALHARPPPPGKPRRASGAARNARWLATRYCVARQPDRPAGKRRRFGENPVHQSLVLLSLAGHQDIVRTRAARK